jgi:hypothetical protein
MIIDDFYTVAENVPLYETAALGVLANDTDPFGGSLVVTDTNATTDQGFKIKFNSNGTFEYLPGPGFSGTDTFTFTVQDTALHTFNAKLTIDVTATAAQPELKMADNSLTGLTPVGPNETVALPGTLETGGVGQIVPLSNGGFVVGIAARIENPGDQFNVYVEVHGPDGLPIGSPIQIESTEPLFNLGLASLPGGGFITAWRSVTSTDQPIRFEIFDNAGNPVVSPTPLGNAATIHGSPTVTALSNGNVALTWSDSAAGLLVQIVEPNGTPVGASPTVLEPPGDPRHMSAITADSNGGFIVAWAVNDSGQSESIYAQRYDSHGVANGSAILVHGPDATSASLTPAITGLGNGGFAVTWGEFDQSPSIIAVHSQAFGANNLAVGPEFSSDNTFNGAIFGVFSPHIVKLTDGYVVSWEAGAEPWGSFRGLGNGPNPIRYANYVQVFDNNGHAVSGTILAHVVEGVTELGTARTLPVVTPLPDGGFAMRFEDFTPGANPTLNTVVQLFDSHGNRIGNQALVGTNAGGVQFPATLGVLNDGSLVAGYTQDDLGGPHPGQSLHIQELHRTTSTSAPEESGPITVPLTVKTNGVSDAETVSRVVISGLPDGSLLTPPRGHDCRLRPHDASVDVDRHDPADVLGDRKGAGGFHRQLRYARHGLCQGCRRHDGNGERPAVHSDQRARWGDHHHLDTRQAPGRRDAYGGRTAAPHQLR